MSNRTRRLDDQRSGRLDRVCGRGRTVMAARMTRQRSARIPTVHGGDVDRVARAHGVSADRLIDFSANINPAGPPRRALVRLAREASDRRVLTQYPDPEYVELRNILAATLSVSAKGVTVA